QTNPKDTTALLALADMYMKANMFDQAADYLRRYLEVVPDNITMRFWFARYYYENTQRQLAINELLQVLKYRPNSDLAMYFLGIVYSDEGQKEEAIKWWHKVIEANPASETAEKAREQIQAAGGK
ncbi:tetratricopeptide repeat protein, partial [bacterium]|nr:tetratricopeptide repeat protein [bacterium]